MHRIGNGRSATGARSWWPEVGEAGLGQPRRAEVGDRYDADRGHRQEPAFAPRPAVSAILRRSILGLLTLSLIAASGCASAPETVSDPPVIEKLRLSITKTRHAIRETREAISRSQGSPLLPELYVRLAELLGEEARYHNQVAYEREERKSRLIHAPQVELLKRQAIAVYRDVLTRFPDSALIPRVRFNIGHELRELGDFPAMVKVLEELVATHPKSPLADEALLVLGDYYFDKSELAPAEVEYAKITKRPLSRVSSLAQYKLGWVYVNLADCARALTSFETALDASRAWADGRDGARAGDPRGATLEGAGGGERGDEGPATGQAIDVRREALVDLVYCYTQERDLAQAVPYLRARAANRAAYVAALRRMADRMSLLGRPDAGLPVSRELLRLAPADGDRLDDARVHYAFLRKELRPEAAPAGAGPKDKDPAKKPAITRLGFEFRAADVRLLTEAVLRWAQLPGVTEELRATTREEFERFSRDVLTTAQERALALEAGRAQALDEVADGYLIHLAAFPGSPERLAITKNLVDVLTETDRHGEAGMEALEVADLESAPPARQEALVAAVSELQKALEQKGARTPAARVVARAALRRAGLELLRGNATGQALPVDKLRAVKFAIALTFFDEGRFREAIDRFMALAYEHPASEEGTAAIFHALDAYSAEGDFDGLIAVGHRFLAPDSPATPAARARIAPAIAAAEQRKLDELALAAAGTGGADLSVLERFSQRYAGTDLGERALVNAFVAARAVGDSGALQRLGQEIVATYPGSEQVVGVISTMARNAVASLDYDQAVQAFEQAAAAKNGDRLPLLLAAAEIRAQLGDAARAQATLEEALSAAKTPAARSQVGQRLAAFFEERGAAPAEVLRVLGPLAGDKDPDVLAAIGLAQVASGQTEAGEITFGGVLGGQAEGAPTAKARAHYGNAEALGRLIAGFDADGSLDALNELTALVDLVEESYMNAARQGDSLVTATALGRLATAARAAAQKLRTVKLPGELSGDDKAAIEGGLEARAKQLDELAAGAVTTCAAQAWSARVFDPPVRACLKGQGLADPRLAHDAIAPRSGSGASQVPAELRRRLADEPDNVEILVAVGAALLDARDPHTARLVLARAVGSGGGGAEALNLLGVAHYGVGDFAAALEAFSRAADGGLEAGRENLRRALTERSVPDAAAEVDAHWPDQGEPGGRLL
ncbi:MAG: hypothetical protein CVU56_23790, partial [Deltaproteobacteria bacterium HGW-Deltaproteobacteria-14]